MIDATGDLFPPDPPPRPPPATRRAAKLWDAALTHRMRVLLHTSPLLDLKRGDSLVAPELRHYDALALAVRTLDLIVDNMGLEAEVDRGAVGRALEPLLTAQDEAARIQPERQRHDAMVDRVLGGLRNDGEQRRPFAIDYGDVDGAGRVVRRRLEFRLVADHFHPAGGTVLRLSNEAINLFLGALELDIEDAQAAAEAVVQSQLARGKFSEALESARNARWQSIRYAEKITRILRETRRDVESVDWHEQVPALLEESLTHIKVRLDTEEAILSTATDRLDVLSPGDDESRHVAEVVRLVKDCRVRHVDLHDQLMRARNVFLDEQGRQAFTVAPVRVLPELFTDVLEPLLAMGRRGSERISESAFPLFFGAAAPRILDLADQVLWQLRPRRPRATGEDEIVALDLSATGLDPRRYDEAARQAARGIINEIDGRQRLSRVLEAGRDRGAPMAALELVALLALEAYAPEGSASVVAERLDDAVLDTCGFFGDELELRVDADDRGSEP